MENNKEATVMTKLICKKCGDQIPHDNADGEDTCEACTDRNTRAAPATDTGLVTIGYVHEEGLKRLREMRRSTHVVGFINDIMTIPLCLCSQAEELLAAERAESERLRELLKTQSDAHAKHVKGLIAQHEREREIYGQAAQDFRQRAEKAEADNAAQAARIKELDRCHEGTIDLCNQKTAQIEALEAKLAAAEKALDALIAAVASGRRVEKGAGGMTIEAQLHRTVINGVPAMALEDAYDARAAMGGKP